MRVALITTTINVPTVLELYRQHGPDVAFFVAGDLKEPAGIAEFCESIGATFLSAPSQVTLGYKCSELIGWNSIQRRNIALLEAVKWGADIIVSVDDDNIPLESGIQKWYFGSFRQQLDPTYCPKGFSGIKVSSPTGWFDPGQLLDPIAPHRGFPINIKPDYEVSHVTNARVGVAAGICLGDPDISAVTRIARAPLVHRVSELLQSGLVVDPSTWTVFNSQNTAFIRELAPAFFMLPGVGRYDDIYASLIMQRVMRERGLHVHFGKPFVWQQRNQHNLVKDLRGEIEGMESIEQFAGWLDDHTFPHAAKWPVLDHVRAIWTDLGKTIQQDSGIPVHIIDTAFAFLEDMEGVL